MRDRDLLQQLLNGFAEAYAAAKRRESALDFDDLQLAARALLRDNPGIREREALRFKAIMVDEFQDTNRLQCDLIDLLDEGNLADNAFLFIGQGMVDQALALRPEERRPLFEEAAGVRRHERRRRQAESELAEAEANLERLRDVLAELRPQARRARGRGRRTVRSTDQEASHVDHQRLPRARR